MLGLVLDALGCSDIHFQSFGTELFCFSEHLKADRNHSIRPLVFL